MPSAYDDYGTMMTWGSPAAPAAQTPAWNGLRSWEMNQPGLVGAAGGLPYGTGDYAGPSIPGSPPANDGIFSNFFNKQRIGPNGEVLTDQGWGGTALGAASGVFNAWMGMKQYGLAKAQLAESRNQFNLNYDAQRRTTNAQLRDRQTARVASNPGAYQSVGQYMSLNGIGG